MSESYDEFMARIFPAGRETCETCGRTNEAGESFHYVSFKGPYCKDCAKVQERIVYDERAQRIKEDESDEPDDTQNENEVICPYCGSEFSDSWEFSADEDEIECDDCYKKFRYVREIEVKYSTSRIEQEEVTSDVDS